MRRTHAGISLVLRHLFPSVTQSVSFIPFPSSLFFFLHVSSQQNTVTAVVPTTTMVTVPRLITMMVNVSVEKQVRNCCIMKGSDEWKEGNASSRDSSDTAGNGNIMKKKKKEKETIAEKTNNGAQGGRKEEK